MYKEVYAHFPYGFFRFLIASYVQKAWHAMYGLAASVIEVVILKHSEF